MNRFALALETCGTCKFYEGDYGIFCINGWSGDGSKGYCHLEPKVVSVYKDKPACKNHREKT